MPVLQLDSVPTAAASPRQPAARLPGVHQACAPPTPCAQQRVDYHLNRNRIFAIVDSMSWPNTKNSTGDVAFPVNDNPDCPTCNNKGGWVGGWVGGCVGGWVGARVGGWAGGRVGGG